MIKTIKATLFEKIILIFLILLGIFAFSFFFILKNKCLFIKDYDPNTINFERPENIAILNAPCGNVIIELYPEISPKAVERFKTLINAKAYDNVAFHRVIKDKLVQGGDLEFGKKGNLDYGKLEQENLDLELLVQKSIVILNILEAALGLPELLKWTPKTVNFL